MRFLFFTFIFPWSSPRQIPSGKEVTQKSNSSKTWKASKIQFNWKLEKHQKSNSIENLKSIQNSNSISSTDKMTLYCHIISKFKRFETQRICFIQLHIAMTLGLKLKYLKTRMTVKFQLQLSLDAYQIYIWVENLRTFSQFSFTGSWSSLQ